MLASLRQLYTHGPPPCNWAGSGIDRVIIGQMDVMLRIRSKTVIWGAVIILIVGAAFWYRHHGSENSVRYQTATVVRGDLWITISATGTLEPEEVIDVGAQVAGQILSFGKDVNGGTVDYGSSVAEGTILARIDDSLYLAEAANAEAQVQAARAGLQRAEADLQQYTARLDQAARDWQRARKLGSSEALAQTSYDAYRSTHEIAQANLAVGQAAILQARANLAQAQAMLARAKRNLGYCTITSPVNGVIIDRRVNIGQTVVASLNAPSLFLLAKDLTRMQVWVAVNEADIGRIEPGQPVSFSVDAFPGHTFRGAVGKIRLNAAMTQNVVTYTVEIVTDNPDGRLLPYLTANVQFELEHHKNVLQVPATALRFRPPDALVAPPFRQAEEPAGLEAPPGGKTLPPTSGDRSSPDGAFRQLWAPDGVHLRPIPVHVGVGDGSMIEVSGAGLSEGMSVVTGIVTPEDGAAGVRNPFAPQFPGRGRSPGAR